MPDLWTKNLENFFSTNGHLARFNLVNETSGWSVDQSSGKVNVSFFRNTNLQGHDILDVGKIAGMFNKWSIDLPR